LPNLSVAEVFDIPDTVSSISTAQPSSNTTAGVGEASAIFGLITGSIDLIKLSIEIYKAAQGKAPSRIRAVAKELPSIVKLLQDADANAQGAPNDSIWIKIKPDLERCKEECAALHILFENICPTSDSNPAQRIWRTSAAIVKGKRGEAEERLAAIFKTLSVLETHHVITNTRLLEDVKETLEEWEEKDSGIVHRGTGHNNVNTGTGTYNNAQDNGRNYVYNIQAGTYHAAASN
jgi:hypothetical protein